MGGSSSSASSSATNATDKRLAVDSGIGVSGDGNSVYVTTKTIDAGTVAASRDVAMIGMTVTGNSVQAALDATVKSNADSLAAANLATSTAISSANASSSNALAAGSSMTRDAMSLVDRSQNLVAKSAADYLGFTSHVVDLAMAQSKSAADTVGQSVNQVARAYDTATNYQAEKSTADSRYLVIAGLVVVGLAAVKGFK